MDAYLKSELKRNVPLHELCAVIEKYEEELPKSCNTKDDAILHLDPLLITKKGTI